MPTQTKTLKVTVITNADEPLKITEHERGLLEEAIESAINSSIDMSYDESLVIKAVLVETETV